MKFMWTSANFDYQRDFKFFWWLSFLMTYKSWSSLIDLIHPPFINIIYIMTFPFVCLILKYLLYCQMILYFPNTKMIQYEYLNVAISASSLDCIVPPIIFWSNLNVFAWKNRMILHVAKRILQFCVLRLIQNTIHYNPNFAIVLCPCAMFVTTCK